MKESCRSFALSYIKSKIVQYKINTDFSKIDIHLHTPEGAVQKMDLLQDLQFLHHLLVYFKVFLFQMMLHLLVKLL